MKKLSALQHQAIPGLLFTVSEIFYEEESKWHDEHYDFLSQESIKRHKKQKSYPGRCLYVANYCWQEPFTVH